MSDQPYMPKAKRQDYETPDWLYDLLDEEFNFTVDAAASDHNAKMERYWTEEIDGLAQDWTGESVWVNPPFENRKPARTLARFVEKAWNETRDALTKAVMLVPVKSDQAWWSAFAIKTEVRFIKGRIRFVGEEHQFVRPVAVLVFGRDIRPIMKSIRIPRKR